VFLRVLCGEGLSVLTWPTANCHLLLCNLAGKDAGRYNTKPLRGLNAECLTADCYSQMLSAFVKPPTTVGPPVVRRKFSVSSPVDHRRTAVGPPSIYC
jgi:hypothetical protein